MCGLVSHNSNRVEFLYDRAINKLPKPLSL